MNIKWFAFQGIWSTTYICVYLENIGLYVDFLKYGGLYFKNLKIINVQLYPELDKYSYKNKLLVLKVLDVESVFNIINYNHFQLEILCKQIISIDKL